jgi:hypothetical protein
MLQQPADGVVMAMPPVTACPLDMRVRQGLGGYTRAIGKDGPQSDASAARLHLTLHDPRPNKTTQRMVNATVTVRGLNGRDHVMALPNMGPDGSDLRPYRITRTMTIPLEDLGSRDINAELQLPGFTATTWVELKSITYDDGAIWTFNSPAECGVRPDPLMLVSPD